LKRIVATKYILAGIGGAFVVAGLARVARGGASSLQARTWLLVGIVFATVSAILFLQES
jgi:hypothetical protein